MNKQASRKRRAKLTRGKIRQKQVKKSMIVTKSLNHTSVQVVTENGERVLASASTMEKVIREQCSHTGNQKAATLVGKTIAERVKAAGIENIAFDRAGYKFHGRIKALVDAAREGGIEF